MAAVCAYSRRILFCLVGIIFIDACSPASRNSENEKATTDLAPEGMVLIPGGEFTMGATEEKPDANAQAPHPVKLDAFWIDETEVTNAQFKKFADATHYITVAERKIDWEELKKQVPPGTPKPSDDMLQPGSMVFTPPTSAVL